MKKFIIISMVSAVALSLTACDPGNEEDAMVPEDVAVEKPAEEMMPMDEAMAEDDMQQDGMADDGMEGAEVSPDDPRGNPVDQAPAAQN